MEGELIYIYIYVLFFLAEACSGTGPGGEGKRGGGSEDGFKKKNRFTFLSSSHLLQDAVNKMLFFNALQLIITLTLLPPNIFTLLIRA